MSSEERKEKCYYGKTSKDELRPRVRERYG